MKRFLLITLLFTASNVSISQITWDGGALTTNWNDAANWVGDLVPISTDIVLLDNSSVLVSYTVDLPTGLVNVTVSTLTITPSGVNTITLNLPSGNTNNPGLTITGAGDALVLNNNAILRNSSGAGAGSGITITNTFRINDGGHYIHNTARANAAIVSQLSTAVGTELGLFEFDVPGGGSYSPSLSTRIYGSLIFSAVAAAGPKTYIGSGASNCTVRGNFTINTDVTFSISMSAMFIVQQDYNQTALSTFNIQSAANPNIVQIAGDITNNGTITELGTGLPTIELNGTTNQQITGTGSIQNSITFLMNNAAGATLNDPLTLPYNLTLTSGRITTTATDLLTLVDNATVSGSSFTSFVNGPMKKVGDEDFTFPIGKGSMLYPIAITGGASSATTDEFTAEYIRWNPQAVHGTCPAFCVPGLDHISWVEYWTLNQIVGGATKQVTLTVGEYSFVKVLANTYVSRWDGTGPFWTNEPTAITFGPIVCGGSPGFVCGTITTTGALSSFGDFTLATDLSFIINPLPIKLISFNAVKSGTSSAHISWELAEVCSKDAGFEIQKSADGRNFSSSFFAPGNELSKYYFQNDPQLAKGTTWYRLKMTDVDGKVSYSKVVAIINDTKGLLITSMTPNPVDQNAVISLSAAKQGRATFEVYNIAGHKVKQWLSPVAEGSNTINVSMAGLPAGVYHVLANTADIRTVFRFVKQ